MLGGTTKGAILTICGALIFAVSETVVTFYILHVSIDMYCIFRIFVGFLFAYFWGKQSLRVVLGALLEHRILIYRSVAWLLTIFLLTISFKYSPNQTSAYVLFALHPLWAIAFTWHNEGRAPPKIGAVLIAVIVMIVGVGMYAMDAHPQLKSSDQGKSPPAIIFTIGILSGLSFAAQNYLTAIITNKSGKNIPRSVMHLTTYVFSPVVLAACILYLWSVDASILKLSSENLNQDKIKHITGSNISNNDPGVFVVISAMIAVGVFGAFGNWVFSLGLEKTPSRNKGIITAVENLTIPAVALIELLLITPPPNFTYISSLGIFLVVISAVFLAVFTHDPSSDN